MYYIIFIVFLFANTFHSSVIPISLEYYKEQ